jgi:hypothetical protein
MIMLSFFVIEKSVIYAKWLVGCVLRNCPQAVVSAGEFRLSSAAELKIAGAAHSVHVVLDEFCSL